MGFLHLVRYGCEEIELRLAVPSAGVIQGHRVRDLMIDISKRVENMRARGCEGMKTC